MEVIDHWREYEAEHVHESVSILQRIELQHAFYSGVIVSLDTFERQYHSHQAQLERARATAAERWT